MSAGETARMGARRLFYGAAQAARIGWYTAHYFAGRRSVPATASRQERFTPAERSRLRASFRALFEQDLRNIEAGDYPMPAELRRPPAIGALLRESGDYLKDLKSVARRKATHDHSEVMSAGNADKFPRYYLQNFHYQSDGWLSAASADRYEMQVETLFTGAGAAMRRQALPHLRRAIAGRDPAGLSLVDIGSGAGAFLAMAMDAFPLLKATALDLSPAYLGKARASLGARPGARFVEAPAEATGLAAASADIVSAVYLFHELPPKVRRAVVAEAARLLKPGGVFILVDTLQYGDDPGLDRLLARFPQEFHEPYYDGYCREDLVALFGEGGFVREEATLAFLSKIASFRKA